MKQFLLLPVFVLVAMVGSLLMGVGGFIAITGTMLSMFVLVGAFLFGVCSNVVTGPAIFVGAFLLIWGVGALLMPIGQWIVGKADQIQAYMNNRHVPVT